ncbi:MAG: T9SS type A sorting domain-containing protein [Tannerella sp.]|nr:T9SS type A sorting domain-containing protein [Tannerella sp.]
MTYNCHGYAWHMSAGGSTVWINTPEDDKYWNDYSYVEVSIPAEATKISFGGPCYQTWMGEYTNPCDHSAIRYSSSYFISKWGPGPRFMHSINDCPYSTEDLHYYARPSISGPTTVCIGSSATYTVSSAPASYTWDKSTNLTLVSTSGNTATFTANVIGSAWVRILMDGTEVAKYDFTAGTPVGIISSQSAITGAGSYQFYASSVPSGVSSNDIEWILLPPIGYSTLYIGRTPMISFPGGGLYTLKMRYYGTCGYSPYASQQISVPGAPVTDPRLLSRAYPNPVSDLLNIELDENVIEKLMESGLAKGKIDIDIRLYTHSGVLVRNLISSNKKMQLDVSNLPNGVYFLHVSSVLTQNPDVITVIVRR